VFVVSFIVSAAIVAGDGFGPIQARKLNFLSMHDKTTPLCNNCLNAAYWEAEYRKECEGTLFPPQNCFTCSSPYTSLRDALNDPSASSIIGHCLWSCVSLLDNDSCVKPCNEGKIQVSAVSLADEAILKQSDEVGYGSCVSQGGAEDIGSSMSWTSSTTVTWEIGAEVGASASLEFKEGFSLPFTASASAKETFSLELKGHYTYNHATTNSRTQDFKDACYNPKPFPYNGYISWIANTFVYEVPVILTLENWCGGKRANITAKITQTVISSTAECTFTFCINGTNAPMCGISGNAPSCPTGGIASKDATCDGGYPDDTHHRCYQDGPEGQTCQVMTDKLLSTMSFEEALEQVNGKCKRQCHCYGGEFASGNGSRRE